MIAMIRSIKALIAAKKETKRLEDQLMQAKKDLDNLILEQKLEKFNREFEEQLKHDHETDEIRRLINRAKRVMDNR